MKGLNYLLTFVGGALAGAAAGVLLAPAAGEDTRKKIVEQGSKIADKVNETLKRKGINLSRQEMDEMVDDIAEELEPIND